MTIKYIKEDLVHALIDGSSEKRVLLVWGDPIDQYHYDPVIKRTSFRVLDRGAKKFKASVKGRMPTEAKSVFQFSMVDVQQGDGMVVKTPAGKIVFIDGGDNKLFARYTAARFRNTSDTKPLIVDAMIVTHGDADHFKGLYDIEKSESHGTARKRLFIYPQRVLHNGLVKRSSRRNGRKVPDIEMFGKTKKKGSKDYVTELHEDLRTVALSKMNRPFKWWRGALDHWADRGARLGLPPIEFHRISNKRDDGFKFLRDEGLMINVHGPIETEVGTQANPKPGLEFLRKPDKSAEIHLQEVDEDNAYSASHTVNGHSIACRIHVGNVRFYLTGDLNNESMKNLLQDVGQDALESEIIKAPHHGSADFHLGALKAMKPVVSLISSGDENAKKEHIHPRATLVGALGNASRGDTSIVLCTELSAFFAVRGYSTDDGGKKYFGFERTNFGIIQIRTNGTRVLVFTHSGKEKMKEAYRFNVDDDHNVTFEPKVKTRR